MLRKKTPPRKIQPKVNAIVLLSFKTGGFEGLIYAVPQSSAQLSPARGVLEKVVFHNER